MEEIEGFIYLEYKNKHKYIYTYNDKYPLIKFKIT